MGVFLKVMFRSCVRDGGGGGGSSFHGLTSIGKGLIVCTITVRNVDFRNLNLSFPKDQRLHPCDSLSLF